MNSTNRAVNRILLLLVGLVLLAAGVAVALAAAWPTAAETWLLVAERADEWTARVAETTRIGDTGLSWLALAGLGAIVLIVVAIVVVLARLGGGRTASVLSTSGAESTLGRVVVTEGFAADALTQALLARPDVVSQVRASARATSARSLRSCRCPSQKLSPSQATDSGTATIEIPVRLSPSPISPR